MAHTNHFNDKLSDTISILTVLNQNLSQDSPNATILDDDYYIGRYLILSIAIDNLQTIAESLGR